MRDTEMKRESDLSWLARNVHEWPKRIIEGVICTFTIGSGEATGIARNHPEDWPYTSEFYSKAQWLAERARLQNKPSWSDIPAWAEWMAQSPNGHWVCFDMEPKCTGGRWKHVPFRGECVDISKYKGEVLGDWRDTQEKRPESATEIPELWDGEGLPPVGSRVVFHADDYNDCDFRQQLKNGMEVEIIAHYRTSAPFDVAVFKFNVHDGFDLVEQATAACFRLIQTEEQKAIQEIETMINEWMRKEGGTEPIAKAIYEYLIKNQDAAE